MLSGAFYATDAGYRTTKFTTNSLERTGRLMRKNEENEELIYCSQLHLQDKEAHCYLTSKRFVWDVNFIHPTTKKQSIYIYTLIFPF